MDFIDDEDLLLVADRHDGQARDDHFAHVIDAGMRGGIDLEHVHVAAFRDFAAGIADAARVGGGAVGAVEHARQDAGRRGLADTARPGEHERLRNPTARHRVAKRLGDGALADHLIERLGPPAAGYDGVGHKKIEVGPISRAPDGAGKQVRPHLFSCAPLRPGLSCGTSQDPLSAAAFRP